MSTFLTSVRSFVLEHEDLPALHASNLALTFLTAALFTLGSFGLLLLLHIGVDLLLQSRQYQWGLWKALRVSLRLHVLDAALFLTALTAMVYLGGFSSVALQILLVVLALAAKMRILHTFIGTLAQAFLPVHQEKRFLFGSLDHLESSSLAVIIVCSLLLILSPYVITHAALVLQSTLHIGLTI